MVYDICFVDHVKGLYLQHFFFKCNKLILLSEMLLTEMSSIFTTTTLPSQIKNKALFTLD